MRGGTRLVFCGLLCADDADADADADDGTDTLMEPDLPGKEGVERPMDGRLRAAGLMSTMRVVTRGVIDVWDSFAGGDEVGDDDGPIDATTRCAHSERCGHWSFNNMCARLGCWAAACEVR